MFNEPTQIEAAANEVQDKIIQKNLLRRKGKRRERKNKRNTEHSKKWSYQNLKNNSEWLVQAVNEAIQKTLPEEVHAKLIDAYPMMKNEERERALAKRQKCVGEFFGLERSILIERAHS